MQSVKEELYSVNNEHQTKIEELVRLNNDLSNLMKNTEIGALYLDRKLCIRKTNQKVSEITNIMESDVGRPISHITIMERYPDFIEDINAVVADLKSIDKELVDTKGRTWLARIRPYRNEYNAVDGIIVTFVDITKLKEKELALSSLNRRLDSAMTYSNIAWWEWDVVTGQVLFHEKKATMLGYSIEEFPTDVYEICKLLHPEDYEQTMEAMRLHIEGKTESWEIKYRIKRKDETYAWYYDRGRITQKNALGKPIMVVGTVIDISKLEAMEQEISGQQQTLKALIDISPVAMTHVDSQGYIIYANQKAQQLFGMTLLEIIDRSYEHYKWHITDRHGNSIPAEALPFSQIKKTHQPVTNYEHAIQHEGQEALMLSISGIPIMSADGIFEGAMFYLEKI